MTSCQNNFFFFLFVGVMYSGEYDACDVTLSVYPHRESLKNMPDHGGNRTYDLWNTRNRTYDLWNTFYRYNLVLLFSRRIHISLVSKYDFFIDYEITWFSIFNYCAS